MRGRGGRYPCPFLEIGKRLPNFGKKFHKIHTKNSYASVQESPLNKAPDFRASNLLKRDSNASFFQFFPVFKFAKFLRASVLKNL